MERSSKLTDAKTPRRQGGAPAHRRSDARTAAHEGRRTEKRRTDGPSTEAPRVLVHRAGGVATLTLNRPGKRNALDRRTTAELRAALTACDLAADVRVIVLRGAGKDFCAGADLAPE